LWGKAFPVIVISTDTLLYFGSLQTNGNRGGTITLFHGLAELLLLYADRDSPGNREKFFLYPR
jgi:hypothetical protein